MEYLSHGIFYFFHGDILQSKLIHVLLKWDSLMTIVYGTISVLKKLSMILSMATGKEKNF